MKIKALLFDMDGVLIDAKDWHYEALNKSLGLFGFSISRYEHLTAFDGLPTSVKLEKLSLEKNLPRSLHSFINEMKQKYTAAEIEKKCRPLFSHEYALSRLKAEGYKIAVCSNSIRLTIENMMGRAALSSYIDEIFSNEDVKRAKPDPEIYLRAMEKFSLKPAECLVCEDNENGVKAAEAAGAALFKVRNVFDVNYTNIKSRIAEIEEEK